MPDWRVPLAEVEIAEDEIAVVDETYRSGWLSMGPRTAELEERFAAYIGSQHAVAVTNCTAALHLICLAAGLGPGDEVIIPSLTFVATANAIRYTGATPVFADIAGLERPWLSAAAASARITDRTRAVMNMTYGGHPGESAELAELAADRDLILLEDAAHGLGGSLDGKRLGTFGFAGAFSFFSNKNLPIGEGGMIVTDEDGVAERVRLLRSHAMTAISWDRQQGHASGYDVVDVGFNYRIDEPRAALAMARLARLDSDNERRGAAVSAYRRLLQPVGGVTQTMQDGPNTSPAHHLFTVLLPQGQDRSAVCSRLEKRGIQTSLHYPPVHRFSVYASGTSLPLTEEYSSRAVTLPLFPGLSEAQCGEVVEALAEALAGSPTGG